MRINLSVAHHNLQITSTLFHTAFQLMSWVLTAFSTLSLIMPQLILCCSQTKPLQILKLCMHLYFAHAACFAATFFPTFFSLALDFLQKYFPVHSSAPLCSYNPIIPSSLHIALSAVCLVTYLSFQD